MKDGRSIDATAQPNSQRHIRNQMLTNRLSQENVEFLLRTFKRLVLLRREAQPPISLDLHIPVLPHQNMSRPEFLDTFHERVRAGNVIEGEIVLQRGEVQPPANLRMREDGFQL